MKVFLVFSLFALVSLTMGCPEGQVEVENSNQEKICVGRWLALLLKCEIFDINNKLIEFLLVKYEEVLNVVINFFV